MNQTLVQVPPGAGHPCRLPFVDAGGVETELRARIAAL